MFRYKTYSISAMSLTDNSSRTNVVIKIDNEHAKNRMKIRISLRTVRPGGSLLLPNISVLNVSFEVYIQWGDFEKKRESVGRGPTVPNSTDLTFAKFRIMHFLS